MVKPVLISGSPELPFYDIRKLYEKTTDAIEKVRGLVGQTGTAQNQVCIFAGDTPSVVFDSQRSHVPFVSGKPNSYYAEDAKPVDYINLVGGLVLNLVLKAGEQAVIDAKAYAEKDTGKIVTTDGGQGAPNKAIGKFAESKTAGQSDSEVYVLTSDT